MDLDEKLIIACREGDMDTAKTLIEAGADVNKTDEDGNTAIVKN